jgi:hypothetical protein
VKAMPLTLSSKADCALLSYCTAVCLFDVLRSRPGRPGFVLLVPYGHVQGAQLRCCRIRSAHTFLWPDALPLQVTAAAGSGANGGGSSACLACQLCACLCCCSCCLHGVRRHCCAALIMQL